MTQPSAQSIIPGIELDSQGQATVDAAMGRRLVELAIELEDHTQHPVDVQHVLVAIIQGVRCGELSADQPLRPSDTALRKLLARHVDALFQRHGGRVAREE